MSHFAAVLTRSSGRWHGTETSVTGCESLADMGDLLDEHDGEVRLLLVEEDDEYAAIIRRDADDEVHAFLTDAHAAESYAVAEIIAEDLETAMPAADEDGEDEEDVADDLPAGRESAPLGDPAIVEDLGTDPADLIAMCLHAGTLPVDLLLAVCEKAGCGEQFDDLRG